MYAASAHRAAEHLADGDGRGGLSGVLGTPHRRCRCWSLARSPCPCRSDLTQILTAGLAARYHDPVAVGIGSVLALWSVAAMAIAVGRGLRKVIPLTWITRAAAAAMLILAGASLAAGDLVNRPAGARMWAAPAPHRADRRHRRRHLPTWRPPLVLASSSPVCG